MSGIVPPRGGGDAGALEKLHREERSAPGKGTGLNRFEPVRLHKVRVPQARQEQELSPRAPAEPRGAPATSERLDCDRPLGDEVETAIDGGRRAAAREARQEPATVDRFT